MNWTVEHIQGAAEAMVEAENLCGDTRNALKQYQDDNDLPNPDINTRESIACRFAEIWRSYQKQAGVNPKHFVA